MLLLPLLVAALPTPPASVTLDTSDQLEVLFNEGVRKAIAAGGTLAADSGDTSLTVIDGELATRFVLEMDEEDGEGGTYRVEYGVAPAQPGEPDELLVEALTAARGGVEIDSECGGWYLTPYVVQRHAAGEAAGLLIGEALMEADDIEWASLEDGAARFGLHRGDRSLVLTVALGEDQAVATAELREIRDVGDVSQFTARKKLVRALRRGRVTAIEGESYGLPVLRMGKRRFAFESDAFEMDEAFMEEGGCGC